MEKTLHRIKDEWAKDHGYIDYKEFYELTRVVDTDQVFIMDGAVNQIAIRYAKEQKRELVEMLESVVQLQKNHYGNDSSTHIALILKAKEIEKLITKHKQS